MERRSFLQGIALMFAAEAVERVFPFRVYSIPKKILSPPISCDLYMNGEKIASGLKPNTNYQVFTSDWKLRGSFEAPPLLSAQEAINWASQRNLIKPKPQTGNIVVFDDASQRLSPMFTHELRVRDGNTFLNLTRS